MKQNSNSQKNNHGDFERCRSEINQCRAYLEDANNPDDHDRHGARCGIEDWALEMLLLEGYEIASKEPPAKRQRKNGKKIL